MKVCSQCGQIVAESVNTCPACGAEVAVGRATIDDFHGYTGDYVIRITSKDGEEELPVGAVVLSLEGNARLIKKLQSVFHIDIDEKGALAARDEATARSQTQDRGIFVINPVPVDGNGLGARLLAADGTAAMWIHSCRSHFAAVSLSGPATPDGRHMPYAPLTPAATLSLAQQPASPPLRGCSHLTPLPPNA